MSYTEKELEKSEGSEAEYQEPLQEPPQEESTSEEQQPFSIRHLAEKYKRYMTGGLVLFFVLLVLYLGLAQYFKTHFYLGTEINGIRVSGKNSERAKALMADELETYKLVIKERGGKREEIRAEAVDLKYLSDEAIKEILNDQTGYGWVAACFAGKDEQETIPLNYEEKGLREQIDQLACFKAENIIEPANPTLRYVNDGYVIMKGTNGNKVDKEKLNAQAARALSSMKTELDLELLDCYVKPPYDEKSPEVTAAKDTLNQYVAANITYAFENQIRRLEGEQIHDWLTIDKGFKVTVNEEKVKYYVNELSKRYNTVGRTRNFTTSSGETIKISGGDYGRVIDKEKETQAIISSIKAGETINREPIFKQNTSVTDTDDIGNTYVEISLEKQHLWFYKKGALIIQGDVVTGNVRANHLTRKGVFSLKYKARNAILRGPDYAVHVDYWMPFDGGIGIHDASWRRVFGGNIYKTNGSHGCVNSPYNVAKTVFSNIAPGTPVIVY